VQRSRWVVEVPEETDLRWQARGIEIEPIVQTSPGTTVYEFNETDIPTITYEPYMPDLRALSPLVVVSTYESWDEIAAWYADLAEDRYQTSSELLAKVDELTSGIQPPSDKILRVRGSGCAVRGPGVRPGELPAPSRPRGLRQSLRRLQGSSRSPHHHAAGSGVRSLSSFVASGGRFGHRFQPSPYAPHVQPRDRRRTPRGDWLFLDPTCDLCTTDYRPDPDRAKHGLLVVGDGDRPGLQVVTDPFRPGDSFVKSVIEAGISPEGDLEATASITTGGFDSLWYRSLLLSYRPEERRKIFEQLPELCSPWRSAPLLRPFGPLGHPPARHHHPEV